MYQTESTCPKSLLLSVNDTHPIYWRTWLNCTAKNFRFLRLFFTFVFTFVFFYFYFLLLSLLLFFTFVFYFCLYFCFYFCFLLSFFYFCFDFNFCSYPDRNLAPFPHRFNIVWIISAPSIVSTYRVCNHFVYDRKFW